MHLGHGRQAAWRRLGISPCCGICRYFEGRPDDRGWGMCLEGQGMVPKTACCNDFERAPGADDQLPEE